ncbi:NfeD family protein [Helicobacter sp. MIT 03-1614]|jgi:membrane protein implicated in regulation of membrane protease activity|nr:MULTISPECIES: NfeD family protein [Helicobacter]TLD90434.1 NfeD family protein [Helicobacter sp. MIT 03-1614]
MSALILLGVGIAVIIAEIFFGSFFLLFVGIGFCITSAIEFFIGFHHFGNAFVWQAVSICLFSLLSLVALRKPIKSWFSHSQVYEDSLLEGGIGEIQQGMVYFKGTLWAYEQESKENSQQPSYNLQEGDKVKVLEIKDNKAIIQP